MQIKALIDSKYKETEIHVCSQQMDKQTKELVSEISSYVNARLVGTDERGNKVMIRQAEVMRFYAQGSKVYAQDTQGHYSLQEKLYELEQTLGDMKFIRISKSEIVNRQKIKRLDLSMTGTIKVILTDGTETYTSRRNVATLKKKLGV